MCEVVPFFVIRLEYVAIVTVWMCTSMMAGSDSRKEIRRNTNEMPPEDSLDGTSARTRAMSYDEIMLRRKKKGDTAQQVSSSSGAAGSELAHGNMERASNIA